VAQEYFINSQELQDKIDSLLPSQGGAGAGFDLSASTQIIPIVDLTESAQGSNLRQDLQRSLSHDSITPFNVVNTTTTIVSNTGYFRVFGTLSANTPAASKEAYFALNDGSTDKRIIEFNTFGGVTNEQIFYETFDFTVFLEAGDSLIASNNSAGIGLVGSTRQIATIAGELVNP